MFTWAARLHHIQKNKNIKHKHNINSLVINPAIGESKIVPTNHIEKNEQTPFDNTSTQLSDNNLNFQKKKKKRLPGEKLIKEYIQKYKIENISNMQHGGCQDGDYQPSRGMIQDNSGDQDGNGLTLAGSGLRLAGGSIKKKRIIKMKGKGAETGSNSGETKVKARSARNLKMQSLSEQMADILKTLADTLVNSYFRSYKGQTKNETAVSKYEIKNQLYRNMRSLELPTTKKDTKDYAVEIANVVAKTLNLGPAAEEQLLTKVEQGLKRLFGRIYRGQEQTGAGIGKKLRGLANRAAKGFQSEARNIVQSCLGDPSNCSSHVQDRAQHHLSGIQKIGRTIKKVGEAALKIGEVVAPALL